MGQLVSDAYYNVERLAMHIDDDDDDNDDDAYSRIFILLSNALLF